MGPYLPAPPALGDDLSVFLDLDGTIVEVAPEPETIFVSDALRQLLRDAHQRLGSRLAILSGRSLANLDSHLGLPTLAAAGSHGLERRRSDGTKQALEQSPEMAVATDEVAVFAAEHGLVLERKPAGVAVHYRRHPDAEQAVTEEIEAVGARYGLALQHGAMVRELRQPGPNKGDALSAFMTEMPFGAGVPVAVGDDLTDEHAFAAAAALGGYGILVGAQRATRARFALPSVSAVRHWLGNAR